MSVHLFELVARGDTQSDLYVDEVSTQGGGYDQCALCGGTDYAKRGTVEHHPSCTDEFRLAVAQHVGWGWS